MTIQFIGQPVSSQIGAYVNDQLHHPATVSARFMVAWAKHSGLRRLRIALKAARERGVTIEVIVGVDEGGATLEGLEALLELTDHAYVFHNPRSPKRTFHPKIYMFESSGDDSVIVGSGNLTLGGLYSNYEAATLVSVRHDQSSGAERSYYKSVEGYYEAIRSDKSVCRILDAGLLDALREHPTLRVGSERTSRRRLGVEGSAEFSDTTPTLFGTSEIPLLGVPSLVVTEGPEVLPKDEVDDDDSNDDVIAVAEHDADIAEAESEAEAGASQSAPGSFYKRLVKNDVSLTGSPGQIIIPIRFKEFFGDLLPQSERVRGSGSRQLGRDDIPTVFHDGNIARELSSRVIVYVPAPDHLRQNTEVRFTFRDRETLESLSEGDYLDFEWVGDVLHVHRSDSQRPSRFDWN